MTMKNDDIEEDYTINMSGSLLSEHSGDLPEAKSLPFRFYCFGAFNLRNQSALGSYKTFVGEQKT